MAKKKKERRKGESVGIQMTPMIDVVFQLLIFFIVTLKQEDILSHLDITRPAPGPEAKLQLLTILVYKEGFVLQGKNVTLKTLDNQLTKLASFNKNISVVIKCTPDSPHSYLIQLLDVCAKAELKNLAIFSL